MDTYSEHASGIAELQAESKAVLTWKGATYKCLPSGAIRSKQIESGGFGLDSDISLVCLVADFGSASAEALVSALLKTQITYLGHTYRVESVTVAAGGYQIVIKATDLNKGV